MTVDVWMQHPTQFCSSGHEMLASLRRWIGDAMPELDEDVPLEATVAVMDAADIDCRVAVVPGAAPTAST